MSLRSTALSWRSQLGTVALITAILFTLVALQMLLPLANTFHPNSGHDFRILYAAAMAVRMHQNPYDPAVLLRDIVATGLARLYVVDAKGTLIQPYVYPPIVAWFMIPLTYLSATRALLLWRLCSAVCVFLGTLGLTASWNNTRTTSGWRPFRKRTHQVLLAALVACSPLAVYVYYWGNPVVLVYAAMGGWCWLLTRNRPVADALAGVVMALALLKPQLALPLAILAVFCLIRGREAARRRRRVVLAFDVACMLLLGLSVLLLGPALLLDWPRSVMYLSGMIYTQPDMPSLIGLLRPVLVSHSPRIQAAALYGAMALGAVAVIWLYRALRRSWTPMALLGLLTVIWCFATPYAHANDELLLVPAGLTLVLATIATLEQVIKVPRHQGARAWLGMLTWWTIQAVTSGLALWVIWRGGVLDFEYFPSPPIPRPTLVPMLLLLALAVTWPHFRQQERAVGADSRAYAYGPG